jgi:UDP-glucose 4-epimerase
VGHSVVVADDLSAGHRDSVPSDVPFARVDVADGVAMRELLRTHGIEAVLHFASRIEVGESVRDPRLYYGGSLGGAISLLESVLDVGVGIFIQSSSAAVFGKPAHVPIDEGHPTAPISPYGETKLAIERILAAYARAYGLRYAALRYFNAAGADPDGGLSERHSPETHLIPNVLDAALGRQPHVTVFGTDYATPDGTCVRDYVHVVDLCEAHVMALEALERGGEGGEFNLGSGRGHSVREVLEAVRRVLGRDVPVVYGARREGDPAELLASSDRAARVFGWRARRSALEEIVRDAARSR